MLRRYFQRKTAQLKLECCIINRRYYSFDASSDPLMLQEHSLKFNKRIRDQGWRKKMMNHQQELEVLLCEKRNS